MKRLDLRSYQSKGVRDIRRALKDARSTIWICPTGGGKSRVFCAIANGWRGRVLVLADRISLVDQAADNLATFTNRRVGIERAEERTDRANLPAVVCSTVQTMTRRAREFPSDTFGLIIVDEADLALAPSYRRIFDRFSGAKILGVTATPDRHDGKPLGDLFDAVAGTVEIADLIRAGYLSRIRQYLTHIESVELDTAGVSGGDFNAESLGRILSAERPLHEVARPTMDQAGDRPTIVFAASIKHAEALAGVFNRYRKGCARVIHSQQEEDDGAIRESFVRREFQFLINVAMLTRGIDLPLTACVVMARPTLSRPLYAQMIGRGTRPDRGKRDLLVLDFAGNAGRHSLISVVDVLGVDRDEETKERARERLERGGDVLDEIDAAEEEIKADPATRERVRAKVRARTVAVSPLANQIDWSTIDWDHKTNPEIAREIGRSKFFVSQRRPKHIPSPSKTPGWRSQKAREWLSKTTPEQRSSWAKKAQASMSEETKRMKIERLKAVSPEIKAKNSRAMWAARTPERRSEVTAPGRKHIDHEKRIAASREAMRSIPFEVHSERARRASMTRTPEERRATAHKASMAALAKRRAAGPRK